MRIIFKFIHSDSVSYIYFEQKKKCFHDGCGCQIYWGKSSAASRKWIHKAVKKPVMLTF